jgi:sugar transferase (PEP-CTERM/EpsH1 system associated)
MKRDGDGRVTVAQVVHNLDVGGQERVVISLLDGLDPARYRSVLVCLRDGGPLLGDVHNRDTRVYALRKADQFDAACLARLMRVLRHERVDVLHCHNHGPLVYGALARPVARTRALVYTAHGKYSAARIRTAALGWARRTVDCVVAVSEDAHRVSVERGGVPADRVTTIINGIDVTRFENAGMRAQTRARLGLDDAEFVFGIVARLTPVKDHRTLLEAFARVLRDRPAARLVIVGGGEIEGEVRAAVSELGLEKRAVLLGERKDVPELMSAFDAFVLSSYSEGLSITLLEAMAAGLPVVATRVGGNAEIVLDGETGLLVEPRDATALAAAMGSMIDATARADDMGTRGRERVREHFGERAMVQRYQDLYERLLAVR